LERGSDIGLSDLPAAREELDRAASLNPLSPAPHLRAGTISVAVEDPASARREFRAALDIEESWYAHFELALLDAQAGDFAAARRQIEKARALNRQDRFVAEALGKIRARRQIDAAAFNARIRKFGSERFTRPKT
jgi:tetratricopeptide (TPR) repeat protein